MKSDLPKVVHPVGGRAMVCAVVDACLASGCERVVAVVGYKQDEVRTALKAYGVGVEYALQEEQLGTGHAVQSAARLFDRALSTDEVLVLCGDGPLIRPETIGKMLERHRATGAAGTLATAVIENPSGYGRIVRDGEGRFVGIVEQKNATAEQLQINEVNPSYYCFNVRALFDALRHVQRNPLTGEYYLTDVFELLLKQGKRVEVIEAVPPEDILSINTPEDLAKVDAIYRSRPAVQIRPAALKGGAAR